MRTEKLTASESIAIDCMKAVSVFSVITAHVVTLQDFNMYTKIISSLYRVFGCVGVVVFYIIGGFFYTRGGEEGDGKSFWKKKLFRLILPWLFCASLTYAVSIALGAAPSVVSYLKYVFGISSVYYYIVVYLLFLVIFKYLCKKEVFLWIAIGVHLISLLLTSLGSFDILPTAYMNILINPFNWIGYFSIGILIRRHRLDTALQNSRTVPIVACCIMLLSLFVILSRQIYGYFHVLTYLFTLSAAVLIAKGCYRFANCKAAAFVRKLGKASYCIYLLHIQIVQAAMNFIPMGNFKATFAPVLSLLLMIILVSVGTFICKKLPFGDKLKMLFGL